MEDKCYLCSSLAVDVCKCRIPWTLMCGSHIKKHDENDFFPHEHQSYPFKVCPDAKEMVLNKIKELIEWNENQKTILYTSTEQEELKEISMVEESLNALGEIVEERLRCLLKHRGDLEKLKTLIESITVISLKEYFTPLEKALLSKAEMTSLLNKIVPETIKFKSSNLNECILLTPSNIFTLFSSYNYILDLQEDVFIIKDQSPEIIRVPSNTSSTSSYLKVTQNSFIITGGKDSEKLAFEVNYENLTHIYLPLLNIARKYHSMAWINRCPAVIGGEDYGDKGEVKLLDSVEVLKGNQWVVEHGMKLKNARKEFTAFNYLDLVFVVGGGQSLVEVLKDSVWRVVDVQVGNGFWSERVPLMYACGRIIVFGKRFRGIKVDLDKFEGVVDRDEDLEKNKLCVDFRICDEGFEFIHKEKKDLVYNLNAMLT